MMLIVVYSIVAMIALVLMQKGFRKLFPPKFIVIDGSIGAGKSTFITRLRSQNKKVLVVPEPVDEWMGILPLFYQNKQRYAYSFQTLALVTRIKKIQETYQRAIDEGYEYVISERSPLSDQLFMNVLFNDRDVTPLEMEMYRKWKDMWMQIVPIPTKFVYLYVTSSTCLDRIKTRGRKGEDSIKQDYLEKLVQQHEILYSRQLQKIRDRLVPFVKIDMTGKSDDNETVRQVFENMISS